MPGRDSLIDIEVVGYSPLGGTAWDAHDSTALAEVGRNMISVCDHQGAPWIAYTRQLASDAPRPNGPYVAMWDGSAWVDMGGPLCTIPPTGGGIPYIARPRIASDGDTVYVACTYLTQTSEPPGFPVVPATTAWDVIVFAYDGAWSTFAIVPHSCDNITPAGPGSSGGFSGRLAFAASPAEPGVCHVAFAEFANPGNSPGVTRVVSLPAGSEITYPAFTQAIDITNAAGGLQIFYSSAAPDVEEGATIIAAGRTSGVTDGPTWGLIDPSGTGRVWPGLPGYQDGLYYLPFSASFGLDVPLSPSDFCLLLDDAGGPFRPVNPVYTPSSAQITNLGAWESDEILSPNAEVAIPDGVSIWAVKNHEGFAHLYLWDAKCFPPQWRRVSAGTWPGGANNPMPYGPQERIDFVKIGNAIYGACLTDDGSPFGGTFWVLRWNLCHDCQLCTAPIIAQSQHRAYAPDEQPSGDTVPPAVPGTDGSPALHLNDLHYRAFGVDEAP